ncbi:zinc-dependent metalloprotease [Gramella sp. GC03-9]|uniref:Zinc-dependent metalloprotease n=1 Tax=Christiangramia oceanisediminis TaxID=2920386 RepID=A0A9X2L004_9FLAO|nr:M57 family metalloprotease [Gramella oceanisediminis]MCP9201346.1 zinc-dependent metalloprotease [Gramella oceanisediminis]
MIKKYLFGTAMVAVIGFTSCEKNESSPEEPPQEAMTQIDLDQDLQVTKEVREKVKSLNFNSKHIEVVTQKNLEGKTESVFKIEGDILMSPQALAEMQPADITSKQYRTYNLVSSPRTVNVIGYTGGYGQGLTSKQRSALQRAIQNYNDLSIGLNFTLTFGTNYQSYDIVVYQTQNGSAGGVAGFPSNGDPYQYIQIFDGMENYSTATNEHVLTHEIGHTLGLRHTDWFSRQSCGQSGEDAEPYGAVHIPGTPTGYDSNSLMLACFSASESGNFGYYDEVALEYLY